MCMYVYMLLFMYVYMLYMCYTNYYVFPNQGSSIN